MMKWLPLLMVAGCGSAEVAVGPSVDGGCGCRHYGPPTKVGVTQGTLEELSGLVASRSQPGVYWAHNDSGDLPRFFAMNLDGTIAQTFSVAAATHVDWEDIGLGPCPDGTCLFLGDIGDNARSRSGGVIYRVPEPTVGGESTVTAERFAFSYPNGAHNAEALVVAPTGEVYIITKEIAGPSDVFRLRLNAPSQVAEWVATLTFPTGKDGPVTGADLSPCGDLLAVRMYNHLVSLRVPAGEPIEAAFTQVPVDLPSATELQSEAVAFGPDGRSFITSSEQPSGWPVPIWQSTCRGAN